MVLFLLPKTRVFKRNGCSMNIVAHNLLSMNAERQLGIVTDNKKKSTEKLSSGYKINRAADDAAGLAISEKMRALIKGLNQGINNCQDGVSWVQIGDGALDEVHEMLQRMNQLTIKSLNGTNSDSDRAAMQAEFDQLQSEIDRVTGTTQFNTLNIFNDHEATFDQYKGNKYWPQDQKHIITEGQNNSLTIAYREFPDDDPTSFTISVPAGEYTTSELIDEIDDALEEIGRNPSVFDFEYTNKGYCNINFENGKSIDSISGGLSYLLHDMSQGGTMGSLLGTTVFPTEDSLLNVTSRNNSMTFWIQDADGNESKKTLSLSEGFYTRKELIDILNAKLSDTSLKAEPYGKSIKMGSDDCIVTGFKGNMFKIDGSDYTSVFYDNIKYANITLSAGTFQGGYVLHNDARDKENNKFYIDDTNDSLTLQPNEDATPTTITLAHKSYTATEMVSELNSKFSANGLGVTASVISTGSGDNQFYGIKITSNEKNTTSKVGITGGSAYDTLFTSKKYNTFTKVSPSAPSGGSYAYIMGNKTFTAGTSLDIDGSNDQFDLVVNGNSYRVSMDHGHYASLDDIVSMLGPKLDSALSGTGLEGMLTATNNGNKLMIKSTRDSAVNSINMKAITGNRGYNDLIQTTVKSDKQAYNSGSSTTPAKITLNTPVTEPVTITDPSFKIQVDGTTRTVTLTSGSRTHDDIVAEINAQLREVRTPIKFSDASATGKTNYLSSINVLGKTTDRTTNYSNTGTTTTTGKEGEAGVKVNDTYASVKTDKSISIPMNIDSSNNQLTVSVNGVSKSIVLDSGTYSSNSALVSHIQSKLDASFGTGFGGLKASVDGSGKLVLAARAGNVGDGKNSSIAININSGNSFLKSVERTKSAGSATSGAILDTIKIDDSSKNFTFSYKEDGVSKTHTITIPTGTYNKTGFIQALNDSFMADGIGLTATASGSGFKLTTDKAGSGNDVSFSSTGNDGFYTAVMSGYKTPATTTLNKSLQTSITIGSDSNKFNINANGTDYSLTLAEGTYTRESFKNMLNTTFANNGVPLNATLSSGQLVFTTKTAGASSSVNMTYATGGSSMKAIYGETITPGVTASFIGDKLVLERSQNGGSLKVTTTGGNVFQTGYDYTDTGTPTVMSRSTVKSYIDGLNISEKVKIDSNNKDLYFEYTATPSRKPVSISLDEKEYTFSELKDALQSKIDAVVGAGEIKASVSSSGVRLECVYGGTSYSVASFSGGFYDRVIGAATPHSSTEKVTIHNGDQANDTAYAVGRKKVRDVNTEIKKDINDTLSLDFTVNGATTKLEFTLTPGEYNGSQLVNQIQEKLNEQLVANGFKENLIHVQIGGVKTGIVGANDDESLIFKLADDVSLPGEGEYIIDGISGNAAFSVFYQTDGDINVAYTTGMKDISGGVTITDQNNKLTFDYDNNKVSLDIPEGKYTKDGIVEKLNDLLSATGYPLGTEVLHDGTLKIYATKFGKHIIDNVEGSAKNTLFYNELGDFENHNDIRIQCSSDTSDYIDILRKRVNTCALDINSICISKVKNATKAVDKLAAAIEKVSEVRSYFGAMQNRIEHTIRNNENKEENLSSAESVIRDTDMAKEMVSLAKHNILEQATSSMLAQANQSNQNILSLIGA